MQQSSLTIDSFIDRIAGLQSSGDRYFPAGVFPAYRSNRLWLNYQRPDTNIFFTTITVFTLRQLRPHVSVQLQEKIDAITRKAVAAYPAFQNKDGLKTYNFYQTPRSGGGAEPARPSGHFPNGRLLYRFDHFRIPDDTDDTAMVYLTTEPSRDELLWLKQKLEQHANGATRTIRNTYADYRQLRAYSTWFGKNMYVEFDACVLSNLLYCIYHYNLPLNQCDSDSLAFIRSVVETGRYRREPFRCSHSYPRTALIIYHIARLVAAFDPEPLRPIRGQLVRDAFDLFSQQPSKMEQLVVASALLKLGERPESLSLAAISEEEVAQFSFFIAGMLTAYEHPLLYRLAPSPWVRMNWTCEAYSWALVAEYSVLSGTEEP